MQLGGTISLQQGAGVASLVLVCAGLLGLLVLACLPRTTLRPLKPQAGLIVGAAVAMILAQIAMVAAINQAPNPGFAHLVINFNMLVVTVAAACLFGSQLGWRSALGMGVAATGLAMVLLS
jgi:drug/metabolite transporter (DMT)-like permease